MKKFMSCAVALILAAAVHAQWQKQNVDTKSSFRGLSVVNENVIWASGTSGTVIRTIDGGKSWAVTKVPEADKLDFRDIEAFDENTAYILSIGPGESSRIYKTTDGGKNWKLQFKNTNEKAFFDAFAFWDKDNGIAMSDPVDGRFVLVRTTDGTIWNPVDTSRMPATVEGEAAFAASGTCIITKGAKSAYLVSGGMAARVFRSTDRGATWTVAETPVVKGSAGAGIFSIAVYDALNGVVVGGNYEKPNESESTLAITRNGGKTWTVGTGFSGYRSGAVFVDKKTVIAVGTNGSDISTDGGATWKNLDKENYNAVQAKGKNAVWAVGPNGMVSRFVMN